MIYRAPCVRFLMRADTLRGEVGGGGVALETSSFVGPLASPPPTPHLPPPLIQNLLEINITL